MNPYVAFLATLALVYRAYSRKSLTPLGILVAAVTAFIHALHPWSVFFALLSVFFLAGTTVTKVKHDVKARLTLSASGGAGEGPRTHAQVLANSAVASILILLHCYQLRQRNQANWTSNSPCFENGAKGDLLVVGIISNYVAVAADTFASELGILSKHPPRLLTSPTLRAVPPGTNGGITMAGTAASFLGSFILATTACLLLPFCPSSGSSIAYAAGYNSGWTVTQKLAFVGMFTTWGGLGSLVDSILGGIFQASVVDKRTGKVVEGQGGRRVLQSASRETKSGLNLLSNNDVNFVMACVMSVGGMVAYSSLHGNQLGRILRP